MKKEMKVKMFGLFFAAMLMGGIVSQAEALPVAIDLSSWSQEGPRGNGNWTVSGDKKSVFQSINGNPTAFVSPESFINKVFNGSFGVETTSDDDYIGFVFGFQSTNDFLLFDWKQGDQWGSNAGFYLSHVTDLASVPFSNHHLDATNYDVLATNLGTGWADNQSYDFTLDYQDDSIKIIIDGGSFNNQTIFDITRSNTAGKFGFYNHSQSNVRYQGFTQQNSPNVVPEPASMFLFTTGLIGTAIRKKFLV